jgi:3-dehydroquinate synthase
VFAALAEARVARDGTVIALGGGVIGDLAGFAAACWMRGVRFVQVPTTLLAMVDSAVGGKTGVNLPLGKNLVGAFHQPALVLADIATLDTLPDRELRAGCAEIVKYGAIGDAEFFAWLEANSDRILARDGVALAHAVAASVAHKARVVASDERESGERALLNFGHTFGHALEQVAGFGTLLHGEAVAIGMLQAARMSAALGLASPDDADRLAGLLRQFGLPVEAPTAQDPEALLAAMTLDKKAAGGTPRFVLWRGIGSALLVDDVPREAVLGVLRPR